jgi:aarF domain-containing kinase
VVVTTLVLEGWSNQLDPRHSVLEQVRSMFAAAPGGAAWRERVGRSVDAVMLGGGGSSAGAVDGDEAAAVAF